MDSLLFFSLCLQMNDIVDASQSSTLELQEQIDIYKEKNRRELTELQRLLKERGQELEKYLLATKTLQDEVQWATSASSNVMVTQRRDTDSNADSPLMVRVVKSRPSLVSPAEPSHAEQQMMSHCSDSTSLTPSHQHHPLLSGERCHHLGISTPCCPLKPKAY